MASQGRFTSQALINMVPYTPRLLAPPATGGSGTMAAEPPSLRILGMSWTWYGEPTDHEITPLDNWDGHRVLYDYSRSIPGREGMPAKDLEPKVGAGIDDGGQIYGPYYNDGFSAVMNTKSRTPSILFDCIYDRTDRFGFDDRRWDCQRGLLVDWIPVHCDAMYDVGLCLREHD